MKWWWNRMSDGSVEGTPVEETPVERHDESAAPKEADTMSLSPLPWYRPIQAKLNEESKESDADTQPSTNVSTVEPVQASQAGFSTPEQAEEHLSKLENFVSDTEESLRQNVVEEIPQGDSPEPREHTKLKRRKQSKPVSDETPVSIQREVLQLLREINKSGISMNALVVLVADRANLDRPGQGNPSWGASRGRRSLPQKLSWNRKKEIVKEVLLAAQMTAETISIKNKE